MTMSPKTEMGLQMQCWSLVSSLSVLETDFNANQINEAAIAVQSGGTRAAAAIEEWKHDTASLDELDEANRRLVVFDFAEVNKALAIAADAATILMFTTSQSGFARTTHVTAVHASGGLVRFQLCHINDIRARRSFRTLVVSICQIYEYACAKDDAARKALFAAAVPEAVPAATAAPATPTKSSPAAPTAQSSWEGAPRRAVRPLQNQLPTPSTSQTLHNIDPAAERALMTELRAGETIQSAENRVVVVGDKRVFKLMLVTRHNCNEVRREVELLALANRLAPLHAVASEHAFSTTQFRWPCPLAAIAGIDIVALVMPRLAPLDWPALDLAEFMHFGGQLCEALTALHAGMIVHFDIKPSNIVVDTNARQLKLLDFGLAVMHVAYRTAPVIARGTKGFMAPEIEEAWRSRRPRSFSTAVDVFSAGVTLRESPHAEHCAAVRRLVVRMTAVNETKRATARSAAKQWRHLMTTVVCATNSSKDSVVQRMNGNGSGKITDKEN